MCMHLTAEERPTIGWQSHEPIVSKMYYLCDDDDAPGATHGSRSGGPPDRCELP